MKQSSDALRVPDTDWSLLQACFNTGDSTFSKSLIKSRFYEVGCGFQPFAHALVRGLQVDAPVIVETGIRTGVSTYFILKALSDLGRGKLYSCDPCYQHPSVARDRIIDSLELPQSVAALFERWTFFSERSRAALPQIAALEPAWDVFIHDSDHRQENMTWELNYAWDRIKPGGTLIVDDFGGADPMNGTPPHEAFFDFVKANQIPWGVAGGAAFVIKPEEVYAHPGPEAA